MSRSAPSLQNPAHRFFEYKPQAGILQYYDKEQKQNFEVKLPFEFMVLAQTAKIGGYSKPDNAGYYSNEVINSRKEPFTVFMKGNVVYQGLYKNEQNIVQIPKAAKYIKTLYIAYKEDGNWVIGNLSLAVGSPLTAWIEFTKQHKHIEDTGKVVMARATKQEEAPTGPYYPPVFTFVESNEEEENAAFTLDKVIQGYLTRYFAAARVNQESDDDSQDDGDDHMEDSFNTDNGKATPAQIAEFESLKAKKLKPQDSDGDDEAVETYSQVVAHEDEPFTDDMIPPEYR